MAFPNPLRRILDFFKWAITLGQEQQNFLGARWIPAFLGRVPTAGKRKWALRILGMSPHYFIDGDNPKYRGMSRDAYLETAFRVLNESREIIYRDLLASHLESGFTVMDYGCGPGALSHAVAPHVRKVFACDISEGALACAEVLSGAENIEYLKANRAGLGQVPDGGLDAVYSFAVIQHVTDEVFEAILEICSSKLREGGKLLLHIQLEGENWRSEDDWKSDRSVQGKLRYKYGLHCFGRTRQKHVEMVEAHGFTDLVIRDVSELTESEAFDDIYEQAMLTATRSR